MSYKRMKAFDQSKNFKGYLSCAPDWTTQQTTVTDIASAYNYRFISYEGIPEQRLDQQTNGGDRSLTYTSLGVSPCWGLGVNWVYVQYDTKHRISFNYGDQRRYLGYWKSGDSPNADSTWRIYLSWIPEGATDGADYSVILSFDFEEGAEGVQA